MRLEPLMTISPVSGAVRPVTETLLGDAYLAPPPEGPLVPAALSGRAAPWAESLAAAPEETARAVEAGLLAVARATSRLDPSELRPEALPESRARTHLAALRDLWRDLGRLPGPLDVIAHVLRADAGDALEPLPVLDPAACPHADPVDIALAATLVRHHGAAPEAARAAWRDRQPAREATGTGALGHLQRSFGQAAAPTPPDEGLRLFGLRDPREEAEFAAAMAQRMLRDGTVEAPREIGFLAPDDPAYRLAIAEACDRLGLPLSGLPAEPAARDPAAELLAAFLAVLEGPAPRTALATVCASPLMPWPRAEGRRMAREIIERGWSRTAAGWTGPGREILDLLRPAATPEQVAARLTALGAALPEVPLGPRIGAMRAALGAGIDWAALRRIAGSGRVPASGDGRFVEGLSLFAEAALPWRQVRQLVVLGMAGPYWPRPLPSSPFFTEGEIAMIRQATGIAPAGRSERLARGLALFRRQLCAASDGVSLLVPARNLAGERLSGSTALALVCHLLGAESPERLMRDVRSEPPAFWPVGSRTAAPLPDGGAPALPADGLLHLGSDLLRLRESDEGPRVSQSPSRLETLLVSPLAWLLDELGAKDRTWAPETLDAMTLGTLIHDILETLFPAGAPLPDEAALRAGLGAALAGAIDRHAPWLAGAGWAAERASLLREATTTALAWAAFLRGSGATVLHNEITLSGDHGGLLIAGRADCLLKLPDGRLMIVDHKRSRAAGRRERMAKGWDLQVALYRAMLERPAAEDSPQVLRDGSAACVTAYHTTLDSTVLVGAEGAGIPGAEPVSDDISSRAMAHLAAVVAQVGGGTVALNRAGDAARIRKERGITPHALEDNALVAAFLMPEDAEGDPEDD